MPRTLTGSRRTDALVSVATDLVWAVKTEDADRIASLLANADLSALVVLLAAMVPDDESPSTLLSWIDDPAEYLRLRETGVGTATAMAIVRGRTA